MPPPVSQVDEAVLNNLTAAIRDVRNLQSVLHTELEGQLVLLAAKMAQKVIRRELTTDPTILAQLAREGLQALGDANQVVVRLGALPDPAQTDAVVERLRAEMPEARVIIDEDSAPGACVVEAEMGHVDESVETRLDNVLCDVLGEQVDVLGAPS